MNTLNRNSHLLLIDQIISAFASTFGTFIISWIVYDITGSKMAMGGLWLVSISAQIVVQFLVGPLIDRYNRTTMMRASEMIRILSYSVILLAFITENISVELLYFSSFCSSIVVYDSVANALIPKIIYKEHLVKVNAIISGSIQLTRLITFPIAGIMLIYLNRIQSLVIIILLLIASYCIIYFIKEPTQTPKEKQTWFSQYKSGLLIYKQHKILLYLGLFVASTSFGVFATQAMYIPYVTEILKGSSFEYGLFAAAFPLGYVIGTYIIGKLTVLQNHICIVMIAALFIGGCTFLLLGLTDTLWVALIVETIAGISMPFWNVNSSTLYQKLIPQSLLGQVLSIRFLITRAVTPLGILYGTFCATAFTIPTLFLSVGFFICIISGFGAFFMMRLSATKQIISTESH